jgi:ribonucleoside-triphosphate reductase
MKLVQKDGKLGKNLTFQRLRRVTGYLVGDYKTSFNDAKQEEVEERVKHC